MPYGNKLLRMQMSLYFNMFRPSIQPEKCDRNSRWSQNGGIFTCAAIPKIVVSLIGSLKIE